MPVKFHVDVSGSDVPRLDVAVVGYCSEQFVFPEQNAGPDSILILDQQLLLPVGKVFESERLLVVEQKQIAIEELRRSIFVVLTPEGLDALVLAKFPEVTHWNPGGWPGAGRLASIKSLACWRSPSSYTWTANCMSASLRCSTASRLACVARTAWHVFATTPRTSTAAMVAAIASSTILSGLAWFVIPLCLPA